MRYARIIWILLVSLILTNCANRSHTGAVLGATTGTAICLEYVSDNPWLIATCAVGAAFAGAEVLYRSDWDVHNAVFVDHLNTSPDGPGSYTNWYNPRTGNNGTIHISKTYLVGPFKCKDYDHRVDITNIWRIGGVVREIHFGSACQLPDGRWIEKPDGLRRKV